MNLLQQFAPVALHWLWQTTLAATVLAVAALLLQWTAGRAIGPRWTYTLWLLVALRLVMPLAPASNFSIFNLSGSRPSLSRETIRIDASALTRDASTLPPATVPISASSFKPPALFTLPLVAFLVWFVGGALYFLLCVLHYARFRAWAQRQIPVPDVKVLDALRDAQQLLAYHRKIPLFATTTLRVPALFGFLHTRLLVPQGMLDKWNAGELRHALLHELVHAKGRDHLLNWGFIIVQAVHWFNPIAYFALRRLRAERELLCDAVALSCMGAQQRHSYGTALVKAAQEFAHVRTPRAIVSMINHNHEVKRRVSMIAQFKPTPQIVSVAAFTVTVLLACFTFTSKAQKAKETPNGISPREISTNAVGVPVKVLQHVYDDLTKQLEEGDMLLDSMRHELEIPNHVAFGNGNQPTPDTEAIKRLQILAIEARAEYLQLQVLLAALSKLSGKEFGDAISIAMPDTQYGSLTLRQSEVEQKLAAISEQFAADHPGVASLRHTLETIRRQRDDRRGGILLGLQTKVESLKARLDEIEKELEKLKRRDVDAAIRYRQYFKRRHELESYRRIRDTIQARILEETISSAIRSSDSRSEAPAAKP